MSLSDIFTPSVVISLAISVLLIGLFGLYVSNKMSEQNHKLNTMFDLVSTLANELQMVRSQPHLGMASPSMGGGGGRVYEKPEVASTNHLVNMIDVSDDSDSSGDESDGDTDEGAESGSDGDGDGDGDGDDENESGSDDDEASGSDSGDSDGDEENDMQSDNAIVVSESLDDALFEEIGNLDEFILEDTNIERVKTPETTTTTTTTPANTSNVKNLNVVFDYKKASLGKLREIVEQKGLSSDTSKLKKQELLKLLEID
jgi:hypothetical protein